MEGLFRLLRDPKYCEQHTLALSTLRIMSRDSHKLDELFTPDRIETLLHLANLVGEEEAYMTDSSQEFDASIILEAQKCLCNIIYNNSTIQRMCCHNDCIDGIMLRMRMYKDPQLPLEIKYFDMRMLFLLSALCADVRPKIRQEYHGLIYLMETLDLVIKSNQEQLFGDRPMKKSLRKRKGSSKTKTSSQTAKEEPADAVHLLDDIEVDLSCEVLKVLFNLTCSIDRNNMDESEEAHCMRLVAILHDVLLSETKTKAKREELHNHTINLLTNMPSLCYEELLAPVEEIGKIDNPMYEFDDMNVEAVAMLLDFLDKRLKPQEKVS